MSGVEGSSSRCSTESEMAAAAGDGPAILKASSAMSEAVAAQAQLPHPLSECAAGRKDEESSEDAGAGCKSVVAATAVAGAEGAVGEEEPPAAAPKHRMSKREVRYILNHKPLSYVPRVYAALKESNPDLTPSPEEEADESKKSLYAEARAFYEVEEDYPRLKEWVRRELADKGYVEVDDEWARREAEADEIIEEVQRRVDEFFLAHPQTEDEDDSDSDSDSDYSDED